MRENVVKNFFYFFSGQKVRQEGTLRVRGIDTSGVRVDYLRFFNHIADVTKMVFSLEFGGIKTVELHQIKNPAI